MEDKKIFVDTDFLSCFLRADETLILQRMFPDYSILVPEYVKQELLVQIKYLEPMRLKYYQEIANEAIKEADPMLVDTDEFEMFTRLTTIGIDRHKPIGNGEAEAITLAVKRKGILASNNLKDVKDYVEYFSLEHITTADVLLRAYKESYLSKERVSQIWDDMMALKRKLPTTTFEEYIKLKGEE